MESSVQRSHALTGILQPEIYGSATGLTRRFQWQFFTIVLILTDLFMMGLAFRAAYVVRFNLDLIFFQIDVQPSNDYYKVLVLVIIPVWLAIFAITGLYSRENLLSGTQEYSSIFNATTVGLFAVIAVGFLLPDFIFARGWLLLSWVFAFLFTSIGRFNLRRVVFWMRKLGYFLSPALIIGAREEGKMLAEQLGIWRSSGLLILGFVENTVPTGAPVYKHLRNLGTLDNLPELIHKFDVKELIISTSALHREEMVELFKDYGFKGKVNLRLSSGLYEIITTGLQITELAFVPLVQVNKARLTGTDRLLKLLLDYTLTIPGLIVISPVLLLIGLAVKLDSPGPVVYRRRVMGVNGKQFDAFKFRTMHINGDEILVQHPDKQAELAENHKLVDDPRITRVGKILRKASLDELPQLFNVLRREMSLVGPRMISPAEMEKYEQWDMNLLTVNPGITGLWQVSGRSDVSYGDRVTLDMHYIRNWSIWLDIKLLIETLPAVLKGRGAY